MSTQTPALAGTTPTPDPVPLSDDQLADLYRDLHRHPELGFQEHRTAGIIADRLTALGYQVTTGVGATGVVGVLENGEGPTVVVRADMDALPVEEKTGLDYASTAHQIDRFGDEVPVMHACGHDMHVTWLIGAAARLAAERDTYAGRVVLVAQPAEEPGSGAQAMVDDGLVDLVGAKPAVVLAQHVGPHPAGTVGVHEGPAMAASDSLTVTLHGHGGHGSRPEATVDPVVLAASTVTRLQTIVSREVGGQETAVLTVGRIAAGTTYNVIPDDAELLLNVRTYDAGVRERVLGAIDRIVRAESTASRAGEPTIEKADAFPVLVNDPAATARTRTALGTVFEADRILDPGPQTGSEDAGIIASALDAPMVYWWTGGGDPAPYAHVTSLAEAADILRTVPSNHSPRFAPVISPTARLGVDAMVAAVRAWAPPAGA